MISQSTRNYDFSIYSNLWVLNLLKLMSSQLTRNWISQFTRNHDISFNSKLWFLELLNLIIFRCTRSRYFFNKWKHRKFWYLGLLRHILCLKINTLKYSSLWNHCQQPPTTRKITCDYYFSRIGGGTATPEYVAWVK